MFAGTPQNLLNVPESLTSRYLQPVAVTSA
jgi:hypothetical protein